MVSGQGFSYISSVSYFFMKLKGTDGPCGSFIFPNDKDFTEGVEESKFASETS